MTLIEFLSNGNKQNKTWDEVGALFNISGTAARSRWDRYKKSSNSNNSYNSHLKELGVDEQEVKSVKAWSTMKGEQRFSVVFKKEDQSPEEIVSLLKESLLNYKWISPTFNPKNGVKQVACLINITDAHLDKIGFTSKDTLQDNINAFEGFFDELLEAALVYKPEMFIFPINGDLFNANDRTLATVNKTPQYSFGSWQECYVQIQNCIRRCIDKLLCYAKVYVPFIKGNHDEDKIFYLSSCLELVYENSSDIMLDTTLKQRKYFRYGSNLLGFAHGDKEKNKVDKLPLYMAEEEKKHWGDTTYRYFFLGDIHHKEEFKFMRTKDTIGVEVKFLRSISNKSQWEDDFGWIGVPKSAEAFIIDRHEGIKHTIHSNL